MPPKKGKGKGKEKITPAKGKPTEPPKPKKIPPPPACFSPEEIARFKEMYKEFDEEGIEKISIDLIPLMLRKLGFNPKTAEIQQLFVQVLEDDLVDTVELHEWYLMIEVKMNWGDDFEAVVTESIKNLGHDDGNTKMCDLQILKEELGNWGEPFTEIEFADWLKIATKEKMFNPLTGEFSYEKFVDNINAKDAQFRYIQEPINYFKFDQKTLAEMAMKKAAEEQKELERKEEERKAREEARRQKMIADGLLPPD